MTGSDDDRRLLPLEGGQNFRDIGGYPTVDGRSVRWGRVYRSGTLADLTDADRERLGALGVRVVCDLRSNRERESRPSRWPAAAEVEHWSHDHAGSVGDLVAAMTRAGASGEDTRRLMIDMYRRLPDEQAVSYRELFCRLAAGGLPLVVHCSAGKDRTGVAVALLLDALGVPRETVIEDYRLTERFFDRSLRLVRSDPAGRAFAHLERALWEPLLRAERAYIEAMFDSLDRQHGGTQRYLGDRLGIDAGMVASIRAVLLT